MKEEEKAGDNDVSTNMIDHVHVMSDSLMSDSSNKSLKFHSAQD